MMNTQEHYFSSTPQSQGKRREVSVELAGKSFTVVTASNVFSVDGLDRGTDALFKAVPAPPATGQFLDIGSGWGPIGLSMCLHSPQADVIGVEVNERAIGLARENALRIGVDNFSVMFPDDVDPQLKFDLMWSNPPIRIGKQALHDLLSHWLPRLAPGGEAWLVVAKKLGADSLLPWIQDMLDQQSPKEFLAERVDTIKGFRILRVKREKN